MLTTYCTHMLLNEICVTLQTLINSSPTSLILSLA
jgi:hypothetical protein